MICFHFSIFEPQETVLRLWFSFSSELWFAFILVSLNHRKQSEKVLDIIDLVVICFHFSIFEPQETVIYVSNSIDPVLWFAFILVSLNHRKQSKLVYKVIERVVICFHFSIFEPQETVSFSSARTYSKLWFAFILVSLNHRKQFNRMVVEINRVVICFHFSIFEPQETVGKHSRKWWVALWFAFILVSLNHRKQSFRCFVRPWRGCDLLSF